MILSRDEVKELQSLGSLEVVLRKLPANAVQSVQVAVATPAVCLVRVIDHWPHRDGGAVVIVEMVKRLKPTPPRVRRGRDRVRLMKSRRGTTADPRQAMREQHERAEPDATGVPHPNLVDAEPEMVDEDTETKFARKAHQADMLREIDHRRRELAERLDRTLEGAERLGVDPTRHVAAIERRIKDLEKQVKKAA